MDGHRKRKSFSDITNTYNLIPTSALRKLVAASTNPTSTSKPPLSILKSSSISESSNRSDASIGSSNVTAAWNSRIVQFRTPPYAISPSFTPPRDSVSKDASCERKQMYEKKTKETEDAFAVVSPTSVEKRKAKGKAIAVPLSSSPFKETNSMNQKNNCKPSVLFEKENQKGKMHHNLFSDLVELHEASNKGSFSSHKHYGKTEKRKAVLNTSGREIGKQDGMEKSIMDNSSYSLEKTIDGKKATAELFVSRSDAEKAILRHLGISVMKPKEVRKEVVNPSSSCSVKTTMEKGNTVYPEESREKGKLIMQSSDDVEVTTAKELSVAGTLNSRPRRRNAGKRKNDVGSSSCPPMTKTRNLQVNLDDADDTKFSKSWTDAQRKLRKKRSMIKDTNELPEDFIEQQRAYFKEIDEFELPEEEVSQDELD
ncbi:Unknown protein [Striga hermonthica]|uniref:Sororin C-terminal region domain-containing protein n=1 Tax=Striga hermonthica TaxID=68872 RepID=A0A9N7MK00_STRHE|nr:Unknown protein [Striga hermonthica]